MAPPRARHASRPAPRVRYDRVSALLAAAGVTLVSVLGGIGLLPVANAQPSEPVDKPAAAAEPDASTGATDRRDDDPIQVDAAKFGKADSGEGRRVVFDQTAQRVWLVGERGAVKRTYLVSGSVDDNLQPGTYEVYSRSERAWGIDGGTMKYMVRFAHGKNAAIGFHDIPYEDGEPMQTRAELGTPMSSGCVRQARPDARALWDFAPEGTKVVVVAT